MKKNYLIIFLGALVLGVGAYFYVGGSSHEEVKYRTDKVTLGDVVIQVRATGTINPVQTVRVGSQVSGALSKINVDFNSVVKKGEILAQIDSTFLYASVKEAEANTERNQAQVNEAKRILNRTNDMFKKDLVSQSELDAAQTTYESAIAQMKQAQAALDRAKVNLRYSTIKSPIDGVIISRDVDVGQTVAASLQAPQLFSIANDLTHMQVEASVDEADIGQIKEGQGVTFSVDSYPEEIFNGTVKQVRLAPVVTQNVVTYTIIIEVFNPDLKLRPGMTATVSILVDKREGVLRVPALALRFQPPDDVLEKLGESSQGNSPQKRGNQPQGEKRQRMMDGGKEKGGMEMKERKRDGGENKANSSGLNQQSGDHKKPAKFGRIWLSDGKGRLRPVNVTLGLNDNRFVEILKGELKDGDEVVIGIAMQETAMGQNQPNNPFAPRMPGGRGSGGGGRGTR